MSEEKRKFRKLEEGLYVDEDGNGWSGIPAERADIGDDDITIYYHNDAKGRMVRGLDVPSKYSGEKVYLE